MHYVRNRRARKLAARRLKYARNLLKDNNDGFYEEVLKAYWGYLSDKLNVNTSELSKDTIDERLKEKGVPDDVLNNLWTLIEECEYSRYAPGEAADMDTIYQRAEDMLSVVEENIP